VTIELFLCVDIARPPAAVWAAVERIETHVEWMADAESITFLSDQRSGVGTELTCRTRVGPLRTDDRMSVTEWVPSEAMGIVHRGIITGAGRFTLEPTATGTRFCWDERLRFPWWIGGPVAERAARPVLRRVWRQNLERLRSMVEREL
jgi:uncharacterized protein YndB with AHSA1/START domain